jgi:hypothetical protein
MHPQEYRHFFQDKENGLLKVKTINGIRYELQYIPNPWMAFKESRQSERNSDSLLEKYSKATYFKLDIYPLESNHNVIELFSSGEQSYYEYSNYFSYEFAKNIDMTLLNDTKLDPLYCINEKNYNISNRLTFTLAFPVNKVPGDFTISINPEVLNAGKLLFAYKKSDIDRIPQLSI